MPSILQTAVTMSACMGGDDVTMRACMGADDVTEARGQAWDKRMCI